MISNALREKECKINNEDCISRTNDNFYKRGHADENEDFELKRRIIILNKRSQEQFKTIIEKVRNAINRVASEGLTMMKSMLLQLIPFQIKLVICIISVLSRRIANYTCYNFLSPS